jgi:hypothetical protein
MLTKLLSRKLRPDEIVEEDDMCDSFYECLLNVPAWMVGRTVCSINPQRVCIEIRRPNWIYKWLKNALQ